MNFHKNDWSQLLFTINEPDGIWWFSSFWVISSRRSFSNLMYLPSDCWNHITVHTRPVSWMTKKLKSKANQKWIKTLKLDESSAEHTLSWLIKQILLDRLRSHNKTVETECIAFLFLKINGVYYMTESNRKSNAYWAFLSSKKSKDCRSCVTLSCIGQESFSVYGLKWFYLKDWFRVWSSCLST